MTPSFKLILIKQQAMIFQPTVWGSPIPVLAPTMCSCTKPQKQCFFQFGVEEPALNPSNNVMVNGMPDLIQKSASYLILLLLGPVIALY